MDSSDDTNSQPKNQKQMLQDENIKDSVIEQSDEEIADSGDPGTDGHAPGGFNDNKVVDIDRTVAGMGGRNDDKGPHPLDFAGDQDKNAKDEWEQ